MKNNEDFPSSVCITFALALSPSLTLSYSYSHPSSSLAFLILCPHRFTAAFVVAAPAPEPFSSYSQIPGVDCFDTFALFLTAPLYFSTISRRSSPTQATTSNSIEAPSNGVTAPRITVLPSPPSRPRTFSSEEIVEWSASNFAPWRDTNETRTDYDNRLIGFVVFAYRVPPFTLHQGIHLCCRNSTSDRR
ncbi:hypothetical protein B0H13DRAFT_2350501 [Mycena leptocephala]|nr:hypothetical protein B0H13DRAFT_2350501 [Mycena leptocephala]